MSLPSWSDIQKTGEQVWQDATKMGIQTEKTAESMVFDNFIYLRYLVMMTFGIQGVMWAISSWFKTDKLYDLTGSVTYAAIILTSYMYTETTNLRQLVQTSLVLVWALRLGTYLFARISTDGLERRFSGVKEHPFKFLFSWVLQGIWVVVTLLPSLMVNTTPAGRHLEYDLNNRDYAAYGLWACGFIVEATADFQKSLFKSDSANKEKFVNVGLWRLSRHPNYLGEIIMWFALYIPLTNVLTGWMRWTFILCPVFDMLLLTTLSGIPVLEERDLKKWGSDPEYRKYLSKTSVLIPYMWLGSYLFIRICKEGFDRRFNGIRDKPAKFVIHWFLQGIWIFVTLLPSIIVNLTDSSQHVDPNLNKDDYTGWSLWTVGFLIETIADYQKARFRCENANKGKFIHSGLWSLSRHPNYLGEMIMWFALYVPLTNVISGWRLYAFLLCPLFDVFWLVSLSGVPPLEQQGLKRWGDDPLYHKYLRTTSLIIPLIW
ncbi:unnamed protein product [Notodromas monacha]|uniref:Steroid 5-alpha reductase C-terminal domain-containing protein n=1 Tax=Notodromas monacha TaxID=399045 RepID=A0A7R9BJT5_9CRUS|nr:unnamed protein product [Notodromas monacha]CAG0915426.1 unnamed protein product [Notodromas monacha]